MHSAIRRAALVAAWAAVLPVTASAQAADTSGPPPLTLKRAFEAAWLRQPEALSEASRRAAVDARREASASWTAEPIAVELSGKSDRFHSEAGAMEYVAGIAAPLWLWGERERSRALAEAESGAAANRTSAARLRVAGDVREAYWQWRRAAIEMALAGDRLDNARRLSDDVARRVAAGDLARADGHQAESAVAAAEGALAEAQGRLASTRQALRALAGADATAMAAEATDAREAEPPPAAMDAALDSHPVLAEVRAREAVASRAAELASTQTRANPELSLATTRERGLAGAPYEQSVTLGLRIPLGSDSRLKARVAAARAEADEARALLAIERDRLAAALDAARAHVELARSRLSAAERRERLARETREFFERSFRLGETDLPTRLRIELEAAEARRLAASARIDLAAAVSSLRQATGLLPQ